MRRGNLGGSGLSVLPFGFGGNVFGWTADEKTSFTLLDRFVGAGYSLIDTADVYSAWVPGHKGGESEEIIGRWLKKSGKRSQVLIATKVGMDLGPGGSGLSREHIEKSVDQSLRRLQTDHIDLYQSHRDDPSVPMEETLDAYARLIRAGKVRAIGASNFTPARMGEALAVSRRLGLPRYETLQPKYNLCDRRDFEAELQPLCVQEGIGVINYYSLGAGFLTGKYRSSADLKKSPRGHSTSVADYLKRGAGLLAAMDEVAARLQVSLAQLAIAWLNHQPSVAAPLASATSLAQLDEIIAGAQLELDSDSLAQLSRASAEL